jgi:hypothetical protein
VKLPQAGLRLLERGVWIAPWLGPADELVLLTITSERRLLIPPTVLTNGGSHLVAYDTLWEMLDVRDPVTPAADDAIRRKKLRAI